MSPPTAKTALRPLERIARGAARRPALFLREFLRNPRQVASIAPSSRELEQRIVRFAEVATARTVVELGPGSGGTTRAMLAAMPAGSRLLAIEVNQRFCDVLRRIGDDRLIVHRGSAENLGEALHAHGLKAPDAVVSGIPFSTIDRATGARIIEAIDAVLAPGGRFVAYQLRPHVDRLARPRFGPPLVELVLLNVPPMHVYRWQKEAVQRAVARRRHA